MYCPINSVSVVFGIASNSYLIQNIFYFHTYTHTKYCKEKQVLRLTNKSWNVIKLLGFFSLIVERIEK